MSLSTDDRLSLRGGGEGSPRHYQPQQQQYQQHSQQQQQQHQASLPRSPYYVSSNDAYRQQPRSPFVHDNALQPKQRHAGTTPLQDVGGRVPRSSPLSIPTNGGRVSVSGRGMVGDRNVSSSSGIGISRSPYTPASRFFVTVVPPADLASDASASSSRSMPFANASSHLRRGTLMPLYPTLGGQLYAISREYGLPSIGGLTVFLCDDGEGNLGPRIGEETWPYLWGRYFDSNADELYHDITSPTPPQMAMANVMPYSAGADRQYGSFSGEETQTMDRASIDSQRLTGDGEGSDSYAASDSRDQASSISRARQTNTSLHGLSGGGGGSQSGVSPRQLMTPSPFRTVRQDWRASPASSSASMSRLPIVARIEWAVDKSRAPWWNQWISGGAGVATSTTDSVQENYRTQPPNRTTYQTRRRSMQLPKMHNGSARSYASSQAQTPVTSDARRDLPTQQSSQAYDEVEEERNDDDDADAELPSGANSTSGYARLRDDAEDDNGVDSKAESIADIQEAQIRDRSKVAEVAASGDAAVEPDEIQLLSVDAPLEDVNSHSGDTQSYAGFSALMGVVNSGDQWSGRDGRSVRETRTSVQDGESVLSSRSAFGEGRDADLLNDNDMNAQRSIADDYGADDTVADHHFDTGALEETDEVMWQSLRGGSALRTVHPFDALSASSLSMHKGLASGTEKGGSAVHEWITKTHSPSDDGQSLPLEAGIEKTTSGGAVQGDLDEDNVSESNMPPQDDVAEVVGLWAERAVEPNGVQVLDGLRQSDYAGRVIMPDATTSNAGAESKRSSSSGAKEDVARTSSRGTHSRKQSSVDAASSRRSSKRSSHRSSRRAGQASQDLQLLHAPTPLLEGGGNAGLEPQSESSEMVSNKVSLLSPIALQETSGTFEGEAPNLSGLLLPTNTPEARRKEDIHTTVQVSGATPTNEPSVHIDTSEPHSPLQDSVPLQTPTMSSPAMLSPRLLPPSVRSPGQMSGSSSSSDMSDALMDMERALALLSPAGFQSSSPAVDKQNAPEQVGLGGGGKRSRAVSNISATESMARARHLSASVSPALRWFRPATTDGVSPALPNLASPGLLATQHLVHADVATGSNDDSSNSVKENLPPRPASFSVVPSDDVRGIGLGGVAALAALSTNSVLDTSSAQLPASAPSSWDKAVPPAPSADGTYKADEPSNATGRGLAQQTSHDGSGTEKNAAASFDLRAALATLSQNIDHDRDGEEYFHGAPQEDESFEPGVKDFAMLEQWIHAQQKQLPHSPVTEADSERTAERVDAGTQAFELEDGVAQVASPQEPSSAPPVETTYATVGVQAEIENSDRSSAQFSLVSDDATSESEDAGVNELADQQDSINDETKRVAYDPDAHSNDDKTPRGAALAEFPATEAETPKHDEEDGDHAEDGDQRHRWATSQFVHSVSDSDAPSPSAVIEQHERQASDAQDQHSAFEKLIRGSFAASMSDMLSSKAVSPREPDTEISDVNEVPSWFHTEAPSSETDKGSYLHNMRVDGGVVPASPPHDDSTTTRGGASTNRNSTMSADEWSQDGGDYDGDEIDEQHAFPLTSADLNVVESGVESLHDDDGDSRASLLGDDHRRESHLSDFSSLVESHDHQAGGGHTPTFLYDRHLATAEDDEQQTPGLFDDKHVVRGLSPMSADRRPRLSGHTISSTQNRAGDDENDEGYDAGIAAEETPNAAESTAVVDGLGIGMVSPSARAPLPSFESILERHRIVSLAGEPMNETDENYMPSGFEVVQSPIRPTGASQSSRSVSTDDSNGNRRPSPPDVESTPTAGVLPGSNAAVVQTDGKQSASQLLRRSMGSISDRNLKEGGVDMRRASTSTTAVKTSLRVASPPPRRGSPRPMARAGLAIRRSMSPMSIPRQRFGALPPSPSLQNNVALSRAAGGNAHAQTYGSPPNYSQSTAATLSSPKPVNQFAANGGVGTPYSPRRVTSPLIIDTGKAQAMQSNSIPIHPNLATAPNAAAAAADAAWYGSPPPDAAMGSGPSQPIQLATPTPRKSSLGSMAVTPPSPRGPRAPPFTTPPASVMPTSAS